MAVSLEVAMTLAVLYTMAFEFNSMTMLVIAVVGVAVLGVIYFGIRFWLISTRPADIHEVETPTLDRLNYAALEHMADGSQEEDALAEDSPDDEAPEGLKSAVPEEKKEP